MPILYHCTAGKDRTGIFSSLLLLTLGVPENTVLEDYALTNKYLNASAQKQMAHASREPMFASLTHAQMQVLMAADPAYVRTALDFVDKKYGSFANYRREALHVSDADVEKLKTVLLMK